MRPTSCLFGNGTEWTIATIHSHVYVHSNDVKVLGRTRKRQDPHAVGEAVVEFEWTT